MTPSRRAALLIAGRLRWLLPAKLSSWAAAMRSEIEQIDGDGEALIFALGCLWAGWRSAAIEPFAFSAREDRMTDRQNNAPGGLRTYGLDFPLSATLLGIVYLAAAGAPARYLVVNPAALLLGLVALGGIDRAGLDDRRWVGPTTLLLGGALLATAGFGASVDGASRWIWIGPLGVQVSLVLLPFMLVRFAGHRDRAGTAGIVFAALALAIQPDRAMAGALALGLAALATSKRDVFTMTALLAASAAFAATLARSDNLPAVPFVDGILYTAFSVHPLAGAAIPLGLGLLVLPAVVGRLKDPANDAAYRVFGAVWIGAIAAAALGNYPTPVVGYGGSAVLGYVLSLAAFPARGHRRSARRGATVGGEARGDTTRRRSALAPSP